MFADSRRCCYHFRSVSEAIQPIRYPPAFFNNDPLYSAGRQALMKQYDKARKLGLYCINPRPTVVKIHFSFYYSQHALFTIGTRGSPFRFPSQMATVSSGLALQLAILCYVPISLMLTCRPAVGCLSGRTINALEFARIEKRGNISNVDLLHLGLAPDSSTDCVLDI